jgi:hypothetical protein
MHLADQFRRDRAEPEPLSLALQDTKLPPITNSLELNSQIAQHAALAREFTISGTQLFVVFSISFGITGLLILGFVRYLSLQP